MKATLTDYRSLELSREEKAAFYAVYTAAAAFAGWLFYDKALAGAAFAVFIPRIRKRYAESLNRRRKNKLILQFRDLMYSVSAFVSSGRSLRQGLEGSIEFWKGTYDERDIIIRELKNMSRRMEEGGERDVDLLKDFAARSGAEDINDFVMVCDTCKKTGGDFAKAAARCADIIGDKISLERELYAMASQKRFEGRIVGGAPFVIIFFIKLLSPEYLYPLSHTQAGCVISTLTLIMTGLGWVMIERMNDIEF